VKGGREGHVLTLDGGVSDLRHCVGLDGARWDCGEKSE
jgi:hypothetical protein